MLHIIDSIQYSMRPAESKEKNDEKTKNEPSNKFSKQQAISDCVQQCPFMIMTTSGFSANGEQLFEKKMK